MLSILNCGLALNETPYGAGLDPNQALDLRAVPHQYLDHARYQLRKLMQRRFALF